MNIHSRARYTWRKNKGARRQTNELRNCEFDTATSSTTLKIMVHVRILANRVLRSQRRPFLKLNCQTAESYLRTSGERTGGLPPSRNLPSAVVRIRFRTQIRTKWLFKIIAVLALTAAAQIYRINSFSIRS